jgi:hypothetical protein
MRGICVGQAIVNMFPISSNENLPSQTVNMQILAQLKNVFMTAIPEAFQHATLKTPIVLLLYLTISYSPNQDNKLSDDM